MSLFEYFHAQSEDVLLYDQSMYYCITMHVLLYHKRLYYCITIGCITASQEAVLSMTRGCITVSPETGLLYDQTLYFFMTRICITVSPEAVLLYHQRLYYCITRSEPPANQRGTRAGTLYGRRYSRHWELLRNLSRRGGGIYRHPLTIFILIPSLYSS